MFWVGSLTEREVLVVPTPMRSNSSILRMSRAQALPPLREEPGQIGAGITCQRKHGVDPRRATRAREREHRVRETGPASEQNQAAGQQLN